MEINNRLLNVIFTSNGNEDYVYQIKEINFSLKMISFIAIERDSLKSKFKFSSTFKRSFINIKTEFEFNNFFFEDSIKNLHRNRQRKEKFKKIMT